MTYDILIREHFATNPQYSLIGTHTASYWHGVASESRVELRGKSLTSQLFWSGNASDASSTTRAKLHHVGFNHENEHSDGTFTVALAGFNWTNLLFLKFPDEL